MDDDIVGVAERLVAEFSALPPIRVLEAVSLCADEFSYASPMLLEQAARAFLLRQCAPQVQPVQGGMPPGLSVAS
ncbi:MAG: hypothetical protein ACXWXO_02635 [Nocardioides sp.]